MQTVTKNVAVKTKASKKKKKNHYVAFDTEEFTLLLTFRFLEM